MGKEVSKPKEQLAPAYFVQYSALWCVLLGFFVMLLSLGRTQRGPGVEGVGEVRDAFGTSGGLGLLAFAKNVVFGRNDGGSSTFRIRQNLTGGDDSMDGYVRGLLRKQGLSDISSMVLLETERGEKVILKLPVGFRSDDQLDQKSVKLLEQFSEVLVDLKECDLEVIAVCDDRADAQACKRGALMQSAVVARFLSDSASLIPERVKAVGYSDTSWVDVYGMEPVKGHVLIAIHRDTR
ncbi:MAG: hypothetical protein JXR25_04785 [Pontiellaceae bacterium]|nr:hypothetical protein [Pontiellaceae bacterium]MBN2784122.1 hypothetical protein [Pontiellaceae bacterium]